MNVEHAKGTTLNPMSDSDLESKFIQNARSCLTNDKVKRILDIVWNLEKLSDINQLTRECA